MTSAMFCEQNDLYTVKNVVVFLTDSFEIIIDFFQIYILTMILFFYNKIIFPNGTNPNNVQDVLKTWNDGEIFVPPVQPHPNSVEFGPNVVRQFLGKINLTIPANAAQSLEKNYSSLVSFSLLLYVKTVWLELNSLN